MVEQWSTSEFESLVEEDQPVSLSRSSFVSKYQLKAENNGVLEVVVKRYDLSDSSLNYADLKYYIETILFNYNINMYIIVQFI